MILIQPIEIIVIVLSVAIVASVLGRYIYKKIKHQPTGECGCCKMGKSSFMKQYYKDNPKN